MNGFEYRSKLKRLQSRKEQARSIYAPRLKSLAKSHKPGEWHALYVEAQLEEDNVLFEIRTLQAAWLGERAERLFIPGLDWRDPANTEDLSNGANVMTTAALASLRARIRTEEHERSQRVLSWIGAVTGLGGVLVAIIALLVGA